MQYSIFRNNVLVTTVKPEDNSELYQRKQSDDVIRINFELATYIGLRLGDYIVSEKDDVIYTLNKDPQIREVPKQYKYECLFEGPMHAFSETKVFLTTPKTSGGNYSDYKFPLTGNASTFLQFIVDNLNRNGASYQVGTAKSTSEYTINFNNFNALEAITYLAEQVEFDWYLEGSTLNFDKKNVDSTYRFQVGINSGLTELTQFKVTQNKLATVVYGYGSTKNLPPRTAEEGPTYDGDTLTENRLAFDGVDGESKLTNNTGLYGILEDVVEFEEIQPEFTGSVTAVTGSVQEFIDTTIDFDINDQLLEGITPKIKFIDGKLIGLTFNISYDDATSTVTMDLYTDPSGNYPNDIVFAEVGDSYKIFDIIMPNSYIEDAKTRLKAATQEYLDENSEADFFYEAKVDKEYLRKNNITLNIGDIVRVVSTAFGLDDLYEIKELTQKVTDPFVYTIKFGTVIPKGFRKILSELSFQTEQSIYNVEQNSVTSNEVTNIIGGSSAWETW